MNMEKMLRAAQEQKKQGTTLGDAGPVAHVAEIRYHDGPLLLPNGMSEQQAVELLVRRSEYLNEDVNFVEVFDAFPWDGAHAIDVVLERKFGWSAATMIEKPGLFGNIKVKPTLVSVEVAPHTVKQVPWGGFSIPGVEGYLETGVQKKGGRWQFSLQASVKRKDEATVRAIFDEVRRELQLRSIYRGQAIKIRFNDDNGGKLPMPEPKFIDVSTVSEDMVVYSDQVNKQIRTSLFTPITRVNDCIANGIPVKRGVLLGGPYGTGKTLAAMVAAKLATDNGITFVYVGRADELAEAIEFAKQYQSPACGVFCEDIDRAMSGERDVEMDDILNIIDGLDTKNANLITVLTTNDLNAINAAMLRPGRLDAVIEVMPPDATAVEKLVRLYGGDTINPKTDLSAVGKVLQGNIPAVIAEVVKRAKLAQLARQRPGEKVSELSADALLESAESMRSQVELLRLRSQKPEDKPTLESLIREIFSDQFADTEEKVDRLHDYTFN
jgi:transitional endoplasmic reticulum ATPase